MICTKLKLGSSDKCRMLISSREYTSVTGAHPPGLLSWFQASRSPPEKDLHAFQTVVKAPLPCDIHVMNAALRTRHKQNPVTANNSGLSERVTAARATTQLLQLPQNRPSHLKDIWVTEKYCLDGVPNNDAVCPTVCAKMMQGMQTLGKY